jgi:hypothetical protein
MHISSNILNLTNDVGGIFVKKEAFKLSFKSWMRDFLKIPSIGRF